MFVGISTFLGVVDGLGRLNYVRVFWGAGMWLRVGVADLLRETAVAFARSCPCGVETAIAFARAGRVSPETGVAFAGDKWVFVACFSVAEVSLVSMSPRGCVLCANLFALRGPFVCVSAKKFAQRAENTPISAFLGLLGELFRG